MRVVLLAAAASTLPATVCEARTQSSIDSVSAVVRAEMERLGIAGLSVAIVDAGEVVLDMGYGLASVELGVPAGPETVYQIASVTKTITSTALAMLVEEGQVSLDTAVGDLLGELPESWNQVTVSQLLSHTSGLPDIDSGDLEVATVRELIEQVGPRPVAFEPGMNWSYNQVGYALIESIIETLSGETWDAFVQSRIFDPLGMSSARFGAADVLVPGRATSYVRDELGALAPVTPTDAPYWPGPFWAGTGLNMTAADLARFDLAIRNNVLISPTTRAALWQPARHPNGKEIRFRGGQAGYGRGWGLYHFPGHPAVGHEGGSTAVYYRFVDDDLAIIVLTNTFLRRPPVSIVAAIGEVLLREP